MSKAGFPIGWRFMMSVPSLKFLPPAGPPEIAFAGRSNVGKSSLINALTQSHNLARTSNTPGRTQALNYFVPTIEPLPLALVDMPGYGYAEAPKALVKAWTELVYTYLRGRASLKRVYVLIDSRHGVKPIDIELFNLLDKAAVSYQIVLTKADKRQAANVVAATQAVLLKRPAAYPELLLSSATKGVGIIELQEAIMKAVS